MWSEKMQSLKIIYVDLKTPKIEKITWSEKTQSLKNKSYEV